MAALVLARAQMVSAQTITISPPMGGAAVITGYGFPPDCTQTGLQAVVGGVYSHRAWLGGFDTQDGSFAYNFNFPPEAETASEYLWIADPYYSNCVGMVLRGQNPDGGYPRVVTLQPFDLSKVPTTMTIDGPPSSINQVVWGSGLEGVAGRNFLLVLGGVSTNVGAVWPDGTFGYGFDVTNTPQTYPRSVALQFYDANWTPAEVFSGTEVNSTPYPHTVDLSPYGSLRLDEPFRPQSSVINGAGFPVNCPSSLSAVFNGSLHPFGGLDTGAQGWWGFNFNFPQEAQDATVYVWTGHGPCEGMELRGANPGGPYPRDIRFSQERRVTLDIKPGACPNPVNVNSNGVLPVAILGESSLDVRDIDLSSVRLAGVPPLRSAMEDVIGTTLQLPSPDCTVTGRPDGTPDLTLKFDVQALRNALNAPDGAAVTLSLTGRLRDGSTSITGTDTVAVIRKK